MWKNEGLLYVPCLLIAVVMLLVVSPSQASIEYTNIPDTAVSASNTNLEINFLGTGARQFDVTYDYYDSADHFSIVTNSDSSTMFSPWVASGFWYATAYDLDESIPGTAGGGGGTTDVVVVEDDDPKGNWQDESLHYLGVGFNLNGERHYGWIGAQYNQAANELVITGYAYETEVDTPIPAGATPEPATMTLLGLGAVALLKKNRISG